MPSSLLPLPPPVSARHARGRRRRSVTLDGQSALAAAATRLAAVAAVGAFGVGALTVTAPAPGLLPAAAHGGIRTAAASNAAPATHRPSGRPARDPAAADRPAPSTPATTTAHHAPRRHPAPARSAKAARPAKAVTHRSAPAHRGGRSQRPWLPTGTGMWIYQWGHTAGGSAGAIVRRARRVGLSTLYVRTGSSHDGFTGGAAVSRLLRATRGSRLDVVAWDFPTLRHPVRDAARLARAARVGRGSSGPHVAAVAPDIETPAEGTFNAAWRVRTYLRALRRHLPHRVSILATVPWPSSYRVADYPYRAVAAYSTALVPMAYWYDNSPARVTARSISYLRSHFHRPVMPVGQGYDGKLDVPSLPHNHLGRQVPRFFATAHRHGARSASLWSWQAAPPAAWHALARAHRLFPNGNVRGRG